MNKDYIGAGSELLILTLISRKDMYGYEIIKNLEILSENVFQLKEGTLYPILHRLENNGYVSSYSQRSDNNKERKYYQITNKGLKQLAFEQKNWELFQSSISKVLNNYSYEFKY